MEYLICIVLALHGALIFLRLVGSACENERRLLELQKWKEIEAKRIAEMTMLVANTIKIDA